MAGEKIPSHNKSRFKQAHESHIEKERPDWNAEKRKRCLDFLWYTVLDREQKLEYDRVEGHEFTWKLPYRVPPAYKASNHNQRLRENFKNDDTNYISPDGGEEEAEEQGAQEQDTEEQETKGQEEAEGRETEEHAPNLNHPEEGLGGDPTGGDPDKSSPAPTSAKTARIADLEGQLANLRQKQADMRIYRLDGRRWPNLAHIPLPPAPRDRSNDGENDPTGNYDGSSWAGQSQRYHRPHRGSLRRMEHMSHNEGERNITDAMGYERTTTAQIEARDGQEVLDHSDGKWQYQRMLGAGGFGKVALWYKVDETNKILDKLAVKEESRTSPTEWTSPLNWRDGLPREISIQEHLKKINPPCPYLISSRGYRVNLRQRRWRLYLSYMEGLTLYGLNDIRKIKDHDYDYPLDFLFYTFLSLAEACLALDCGWWGGEENEPPAEEMEKTGGRKEGWIPIVHRDIKSPNVFLDRPSQDDMERWDMYPTPCLGDMGLAFEAYPDDPYNPDIHTGGGTFGYMAPEQHEHRPIGVPFARKLSDRTNVYAIATTIFDLWQDRLPGFLASDQEQSSAEFSSGKSSDCDNSADLPPDRDNNEIWEELVLHYRQCPPQRLTDDHWVPFSSPAVDNWIKKQRDAVDSPLQRYAEAPHWVYLWELEKWKTSWLLRNTAAHDRSSSENWFRTRPLRGDKEHKLASILRQCLAWDTDARPSIRKLRDMVKDAIVELEIKPSRTNEELATCYRVWRRGGLLYPMGEEQTQPWIRKQDDKFFVRYRADMEKGKEELYRRAKLGELRPAPTDLSDLEDEDDDEGGLTQVRNKRKATEAGSERNSKSARL